MKGKEEEVMNEGKGRGRYEGEGEKGIKSA